MNNEYVKRKVAPKDRQSCLICQRLTDVVLFNQSGPDWIYTCNLHLEDNPQFVTPLYSPEYYHSVEEMKRCQLELTQCKKKELHTGSWDGWITTIFNKKRIDDNKEQDGDDDTKGTTVEPATTPPVNLERELQVKYDKALENMTTLQTQNKTFKLSDKMFQYRLLRRKEQQQHLQQRKRQAELAKKEAESYTNTDPTEFAEKFSFPAAPKGDIK
ncbi:VPS4-associated protein 1 [Monosporozyma servazzii]